MSLLKASMGFFLLSGVALALPVHADAPTIPEPPSYTVTITGYNAVPEQTSDHPLETASGVFSNPKIIAARSVDLADELPFGTIIEIDGSHAASKDICGYNVVAPHIGYRVIADTMNERYADRVDVLFSTKTNYVGLDGSTTNAASVLGVCKDSTIRVVGYVNINHLPETQAELATIVEEGDARAMK